MTVGDRVIYETLPKNPESASRDLAVKYDNFARGGRKLQTAASSERSVLSQYREIAQKNLKIKECNRLVQAVMHHLQASFVFDPNPKLMHGYERIGNNTALLKMARTYLQYFTRFSLEMRIRKRR